MERRRGHTFVCPEDISQLTGVLWQSGPLLWIYPHVSPNYTLEYCPTAVPLPLQTLKIGRVKCEAFSYETSKINVKKM